MLRDGIILFLLPRLSQTLSARLYARVLSLYYYDSLVKTKVDLRACRPGQLAERKGAVKISLQSKFGLVSRTCCQNASRRQRYGECGGRGSG